jgi:hypothetical protein
VSLDSIDKTKYDSANAEPYILLTKLDSEGQFTGYVQQDGNYTVFLLNTSGNIEYIYYKTAVELFKPKDEITLLDISPYDIKVGGLLNYSLTNQTDANVSFSIFAGTKDYYSVQVVDYNATPTNRKYLPRNYNIRIPMGIDYESIHKLQPYLINISDSIVPIIKVVDIIGQTIPKTLVEMYKYINSELTLVGSNETDASGRIRFIGYPLDSYFFNFVYKNITMLSDVRIVPTTSTEIFTVTIDISEANESDLTFQSLLYWGNTLETYDLLTSTEITYETDIYTSSEPDSITFQLIENDIIKQTNNCTPGVYETECDGNFSTSLLDLSEINLENTKIVVQITSGSIIYTYTKYLIINKTNTINPINAFKKAAQDLGQPWALIISILITAFLIGFLKYAGVPLDGIQMGLLTVLMLGLFLFMGWLKLGMEIPIGVDVSIYMYVFMVAGVLYMLAKRDK